MTRFPVVALALLLLTPAAFAQETPAAGDVPSAEPPAPRVTLDASVTLTSRFIYRGIDLGEAPQVQPVLALGVGNFEVAAFSSHPIAQPADSSPDAALGPNYREVLFWMLYRIETAVGTFTPYVQNHYNPNAGRLFDFDNDTGAHHLQAQFFYNGLETFPVDLLIGYVFYGPARESVYLEGGYTFEYQGLGVRPFISGTPGSSPFNGTDSAAITQLGITASRAIPITDRFALPISATFVFNPYTENAFAAVGVTL